MKTIRLIAPIWQGGVNPDYYFGAELLSHIVPPSNTAETFKMVIDDNFEKNCRLRMELKENQCKFFKFGRLKIF